MGRSSITSTGLNHMSDEIKYYRWVESFDRPEVLFRLIDGELQRKDGDCWYAADDFLLTREFLIEVGPE
jgi:hypothetical protein